jgi:5-amino-6-(5-phospho-D-ribitylamino)uracil phosphatase
MTQNTTQNYHTLSQDRLFVSDLDGTLLDDSGELSPSSLQRLNRLIDRGLRFTIATARSQESALPLLKGLKLKLPVIFFNGVFLSDLTTGKDLGGSEFISAEIVKHMLKIVEPIPLDPFIYTVADQHLLYYRSASNPGAQAYLDGLNGDGRLCQTQQFIFTEKESISGFLLIDQFSTLEPIYLALKEKYPEKLSMYFAKDLYNEGYYWLQTYNKNATKGHAVVKLAKQLNTPLSQVTVFGDYLNDLDMFQVAGHSIAVGNAQPEVKAQANEIIGTNNEGAVIDYLESQTCK